ncbi:MAG: NfeD family protein [Verrucomicrobiota bacterium]|nr:NfeD family protein [Verrucomicrobiota bacterium]
MELVIILLVAGAVLLMLETVLPGLIVGLCGFACWVAAVAVAFQRTENGPWVLLFVMAGGGIGTVLWFKYFPRSRYAQSLMLDNTIGGEPEVDLSLMDQVGVALSDLRPSGVATINDRRMDVLAEGGLIEAGTEIKVVEVTGLRVVVRALD